MAPTLLMSRRLARRIAALAAACVLAIAFGAASAKAIITEPIPANAAVGPPPIPSLPAASDTPPPADVISDPVEPGAECGGWQLQSSYAGIWPAGSSWWEYECTLAEVQYPSCYGLPGNCDAGFTVWGSWTDRFYWDGSQSVFSGENSQFGCEHWWDAPSSQWYAVVTPGCPPAQSPPPPPPPPPNAAPTASFAFTCAALVCDFDGSASADADGSIAQYEWQLGDGATASGRTARHGYAQAATYTVKLTVTDDDAASDSISKPVAPVAGLAARGYKVRSLRKVDLTWSGSGGGGFDVYRDGQRIATTAVSSYTDDPGGRGVSNFTYRVCRTGGSICSNQTTVSF